MFFTPYVWSKSLSGWMRRHLPAPWVTSSLAHCDKREGNVNLYSRRLNRVRRFFLLVGERGGGGINQTPRKIAGWTSRSKWKPKVKISLNPWLFYFVACSMLASLQLLRHQRCSMQYAVFGVPRLTSTPGWCLWKHFYTINIEHLMMSWNVSTLS